MSPEDEPKTIGLTETGKTLLRQLMDRQCFKMEMDAFRFAAALALHRRKIMPPLSNVKTIWSVATFGDLYEVTKALREDDSEAVFKTIERLAEWGLRDLSEMLEENGTIDVPRILEESS
jgi:hypothetical protein